MVILSCSLKIQLINITNVHVKLYILKLLNQRKRNKSYALKPQNVPKCTAI